MIDKAPKNVDAVKHLSKELLRIGLTKIDTAPDYANAEELLGEACDNRAFRLQTKWKLGSVSPEEQHVASQVRLGSNEVWANLLHNSDRLLSFPDPKKIIHEFAAWLGNRPSSRIGFSVYNLEEVRAVMSLELEGGVLQIPYNILSQELLWSEEVLSLKSKGYTVQVRSVLMRGMLTESRELTKAAQLPSIEAARQALHSVCSQHNIVPGGLLMFDALRQHPVDEVVLGISSPEEVAYLLEADAKSAIYPVAHEHLSNLLKQIKPSAEEVNPLYW